MAHIVILQLPAIVSIGVFFVSRIIFGMATNIGFSYNQAMEMMPAYLTGFLAVLLLSAFVKILTTLSILRYGIGLHGAGFGIVVVTFSLALSLLIMHDDQRGQSGISLILGGSQTAAPGAQELEQQYRPFLEKHTDAAVLKKFVDLKARLDSQTADKVNESLPQLQAPFPVLISAFLVSELKEAFQIGFIILIPFFVIDILVANILLVLNATQISQSVVSLPLKILLFFAVDGWALLSEKLISGYI